jgi:hypothetical protein
MFGEYSVIKDNKVMLKQRNNITPEGRKQILNMLSHNNKEVGYKKINHKGNISIEEVFNQYYYHKSKNITLPAIGKIVEISIKNLDTNKEVKKSDYYLTNYSLTITENTDKEVWYEVFVAYKNNSNKKYYSSFFEYGTVNHPFKGGRYPTLPENSIAQEVITQNNTLSYQEANRVLDIENKQKVDWGTAKITSDYKLDSYKNWFIITFGMIDEKIKVNLPIIDDDCYIQLPHKNILKDKIKITSIIDNNYISYYLGSNFTVDWENGIVHFIKNETNNICVTKNFYENVDSSDSSSYSNVGYKNNIVEIEYKWSCAKDIPELKNGVCGLYVNAKPSVVYNSSTYLETNYFGIGCFSCDYGNTWNGSVIPWKGQEIKNFNLLGTNSYYSHNMTGFFALGYKEEHVFLTLPYATISPTNFAFAFSTNGENSFFMKNLVFLTNSATPNSPCEILLSNQKTINDDSSTSDSNSVVEIKTKVEWCGIKEDENGSVYAEWKGYLYPDEGNEIDFKSVNMLFSNTLTETSEIKYPDSANIKFSSTDFEETWQKNANETIEVSYKIFFSNNSSK